MTTENQKQKQQHDQMMNEEAGKPHYLMFGIGTHKRTIVIDPLGQFKGVKVGALLDALGILPMWLSEINDNENIMQEMKNRYQYGTNEMGGEVTPAGVYRYPDDPDLFPIATVTIKDKTAIFYEYSMFSVLDNNTGKSATVRMD
jgi:hypothetical protein